MQTVATTMGAVILTTLSPGRRHQHVRGALAAHRAHFLDEAADHRKQHVKAAEPDHQPLHPPDGTPPATARRWALRAVLTAASGGAHQMPPAAWCLRSPRASSRASRSAVRDGCLAPRRSRRDGRGCDRGGLDVGAMLQQVGRDAELSAMPGLPERVIDIAAVGRRCLLDLIAHEREQTQPGGDPQLVDLGPVPTEEARNVPASVPDRVLHRLADRSTRNVDRGTTRDQGFGHVQVVAAGRTRGRGLRVARRTRARVGNCAPPTGPGQARCGRTSPATNLWRRQLAEQPELGNRRVVHPRQMILRPSCTPAGKKQDRPGLQGGRTASPATSGADAASAFETTRSIVRRHR